MYQKMNNANLTLEISIKLIYTLKGTRGGGELAGRLSDFVNGQLYKVIYNLAFRHCFKISSSLFLSTGLEM